MYDRTPHNPREGLLWTCPLDSLTLNLEDHDQAHQFHAINPLRPLSRNPESQIDSWLPYG